MYVARMIAILLFLTLFYDQRSNFVAEGCTSSSICVLARSISVLLCFVSHTRCALSFVWFALLSYKDHAAHMRNR